MEISEGGTQRLSQTVVSLVPMQNTTINMHIKYRTTSVTLPADDTTLDLFA